MAQNRKAKPVKAAKKFYWVLGLVAIAGIVALAMIVVRGRTGAAAMEPVAVEGVLDPQGLVERAQGVSVGPDDAPVKMLVFSDFQCPYCGTFALQVEPVLKQEFVAPGKLQIVYYDFPLGGSHRFSFLASRAARCAGDQDKFWEFHDILFARQSDWSFDANPPVNKFIDLGREVGITGNDFEKCVKSDKYQDVVSANRALGERLQVNATPTLFMNGRKVPSEMGLDVSALRDLINTSAATP